MKAMFAQLMAVLFLVAVSQNTSFSQDIPDIVLGGTTSSCAVSDVSGKVTYKAAGSTTAMPVTAGTVLREDATVIVSDGGSITLAKDERSLTVNKKGIYKMTDLTKNVQEKGEVSRFARMAFAAKGYSPDTTKNKKGWGDKDSLLISNPAKGKVPIKPITFTWTSMKAGSTYNLIIYQNANGSPILSVKTSIASFSLDPSQLSYETGRPCYAQVTLENDNHTFSEPIKFTFVPVDNAETVLTSLKNDNEYMKGSSLQKTLMEAYEFENNDYNTLAYSKYQEAMKMGENNQLTAQMYAAFLDRMSK
ncbi:MAG: hypothetical protein K9J37_16720 [Saprospiraceae bacterium]|nr:hypothetical protein [Saprospiraceae bacterium]MCF8251559.1 hypothetical protein [Saprospiraceae bacterium]MCF8280889.1 hypothetical protein [Bacteroidales bacterium]MCF8310931.1 hypothetical protein [Saprospiraceae bacterium]MCF8439733.1 hypothetical protein [Saprospiraceae bacterium]